MSLLFGRNWSRADLMKRVGDLSQLAGIRQGEWSDGPERGQRIVEFRSGGGLSFTILLDRGLDIGPAEYRGIPLAWCSPTGFPHPAYSELLGKGWLRTFGGGLLTGCGLTYLGPPDRDGGEELGMHGRLSILPARNVQSGEEWDGDECHFWLKGEVRQAQAFNENLCLTRHISVGLGGNTIAMIDKVRNLGHEPAPLMLLYHTNLGFPLLDSCSYLTATPHHIKARDAEAQAGLPYWDHFQPPSLGFREQVFYHDLIADANGWTSIHLVNPLRSIQLTLRARKEELPNLVQWKVAGQGAYVLGLEPSNCLVEGRSKERARGTLQFIQPGEERSFSLELVVQELRDEGARHQSNDLGLNSGQPSLPV